MSRLYLGMLMLLLFAYSQVVAARPHDYLAWTAFLLTLLCAQIEAYRLGQNDGRRMFE